MADIKRMRATENAFITGINRAKEMGLQKPYDVMICIRSELKKSGLQIVWQRGAKHDLEVKKHLGEIENGRLVL